MIVEIETIVELLPVCVEKKIKVRIIMLYKTWWLIQSHYRP